MRTQGSKRLLILVKSVEPDGWQDQMGSSEHTRIPPLGTLNKLGQLTPEKDTDVLETGFQRNEAVMGGFEPLLGKSTLSFSDDPEKQDVQDISYPKQYARGHGTFTGSLEMFKRKDSGARVIGAVDGDFDTGIGSYKPFQDFREFEFWVFENPDIMGLNVSSADELVKHYFCIMDKLDTSYEIPISFSVPVSRTFYERIPNWEVPSGSQGSAPTSEPIVNAGDLTDDFLTVANQPREHTRLECTFASQDDDLVLRVSGLNIMEEPVHEDIAVAQTDTLVISKRYYTQIDSIEVIGTLTNGTVTIDDYDWKPR